MDYLLARPPAQGRTSGTVSGLMMLAAISPSAQVLNWELVVAGLAELVACCLLLVANVGCLAVA